MSWIKIESHLRTKPEVIDIADKLGIKDTHAQGVCLAFWQWMDGITTNGTAKVRRSMIDRVVNEPGFAAAMEQVGWLAIDDTAGTITMPNWDRHSSETAKDRALNSRRQKRHRDKASNGDVTESSDDSNATVTQERYATVTKVTQVPLPEERRIEEKRKEEKTSSSPTPSGNPGGGGEGFGIHPLPTPEAVKAASAWQQPANPNAIPSTTPAAASNPHLCAIIPSNGQILTTSETFRRFWEAYPKKDGKAAAAAAWNLAITRDNADPEHMIYAASREPSANKTGDDAKYRPAPAKWIEDGKYLTVPPPPKPKQIDPEMAAIMAERRKAADEAEAERQAKSKAEMEALWASPVYAEFRKSIGAKL